jgi:hypothetical protein
MSCRVLSLLNISTPNISPPIKSREEVPQKQQSGEGTALGISQSRLPETNHSPSSSSSHKITSKLHHVPAINRGIYEMFRSTPTRIRSREGGLSQPLSRLLRRFGASCAIGLKRGLSER